MQMKRFRIQNYKKINDTDWIDCDSLTAFVGINEAGKSAIFRGLSKFNPSDGEKYNGLKEFPRHRYTVDYSKDSPVSSVEFELDTYEQKDLSEICSILKNTESIVGTRYYSNICTIEFLPKLETNSYLVSDYLKSLRVWMSEVENSMAIEGKGEELKILKKSLIGIISPLIVELEKEDSQSTIPADIVANTHSQIMSNMNEAWQQERFKEITNESQKYVRANEIHDELEKAKNWFLDKVPRFIYFDNYGIIQSAINVGEFIRNLQQDPDNPKLRITKCLFDHVQLDLKKIQELDPNNQEDVTKGLQRIFADERSILLSSASTSMTKQFANWWEKKKYRFRYDIDGQMFRVWVSDNLDESEIELEQRSAGMQYFFSFYLVFLVEATGAHANSILLIDEPGLHYHGTAQKKAVEFLQKISQDNQVLYTTHSPFMIDPDRLYDVRIVHEDKSTGNTLVSSDVWPNDKDALFPLQAGLGYTVAQTLFYSKHQLIVEGITDYWIFKAMNKLLMDKKMKSLDMNSIITPASGTRNVSRLAVMLMGNEINIVVFLDGDQAGIQTQKSLKEKLNIECILSTSYINKKNGELEDLFPEELYLKAVQKSYPGKNLDFDENEGIIENIIDRLESLFKRREYGKFEKGKPAKVLADWITNEAEYHKISDETCKTFETIFTDVNEKLIPIHHN